MAYSDRYPAAAYRPHGSRRFTKKTPRKRCSRWSASPTKLWPGAFRRRRQRLQEAMWLANRARQWRTYDRYLRGDRSEELMQNPTYINLEREWDPEKRGTP